MSDEEPGAGSREPGRWADAMFYGARAESQIGNRESAIRMAERVGFEPTRDLRPYTLSRRA